MLIFDLIGLLSSRKLVKVKKQSLEKKKEDLRHGDPVFNPEK